MDGFLDLKNGGGHACYELTWSFKYRVWDPVLLPPLFQASTEKASNARGSKNVTDGFPGVESIGGPQILDPWGGLEGSFLIWLPTASGGQE